MYLRNSSYALIALSYIPDFHEVGARGENEARVFAEAHVVDIGRVVGEGHDLFTPRQVPHLGCLVCKERLCLRDVDREREGGEGCQPLLLLNMRVSVATMSRTERE